jgi:hypothetical protein
MRRRIEGTKIREWGNEENFGLKFYLKSENEVFELS